MIDSGIDIIQTEVFYDNQKELKLLYIPDTVSVIYGEAIHDSSPRLKDPKTWMFQHHNNLQYKWRCNNIAPSEMGHLHTKFTICLCT